MKSIESKIELLDTLYKNIEQTTLYFVYGEKGLGKSYAINKFLKKHSNNKILHITSGLSNDLYLEPLEQAISKNINFFDYDESTNLTYNEKLIRNLINFCSNNKCILYFENIQTFENKLLLFTKSFLNNLLLNYSELKIFIIIEFDNNDEENNNINFIQNLYDLFPAEFIKFERVSNNELKDHLYKSFQNGLEICDEDLDYIIDSSFGNIKLCNIIINYLKQKEIILMKGNIWYCKKLKNGILSSILKKSIQERYAKLDETLKNILKQSSLLGFEFDSMTLSNTFCILRADDQLKKIEEISSLILEKESDELNFSFENQEIFLFTQNQVTKEEKNTWYNILEKYFKSLYLKYSEINSREKNILSTNYILKSANYAMLGENYQNAYINYKIALSNLINNMDYEKSLIAINRIEQLSAILPIDDFMMIKVLYWKAECYEYTGKYLEAKKYYSLCITEYHQKISNIYDLQYKIAYCTYYSSEVDNALQQLLTLIDCELKPTIFCKVSSLLATIYQEIGEHEKSLFYYNQAISICEHNHMTYEYNVQLRKAQVRNDFTKSLKDIEKSIIYFEKERDVKELAKAEHNLGLNYLVLGECELALPHFFKSIKLFNSFSSIDVLYPYVSLGIYYAIYKKDYNEAINYFEKANFDEMNDYKKLCVYSNLALCYIAKKQYKLASELLQIIDNMDARKRNYLIPYYHKTFFFAQAAYYVETNNLDHAVEIYSNCLDLNLTIGQKFFVENQIKKIKNNNNESNLEISDKLYIEFNNTNKCFTFLKFVE